MNLRRLVLSLLVFPMALGVAGASHAAQDRWRTVYAEDGRVEIAFDSQTAASHGRGLYRIWVRWRWAEPQTQNNGTKYDLRIEQRDVNCSTREYNVRRVQHFFAGTNVYSGDWSDERDVKWTQPTPESLAEALVTGFCTSRHRPA